MATSLLKKVFCTAVVALVLCEPLTETIGSALSSGEPVLDHAWREYEYTPFSYASAQYPPIYQDVDVLHYTIDAVFILGNNYPATRCSGSAYHHQCAGKDADAQSRSLSIYLTTLPSTRSN